MLTLDDAVSALGSGSDAHGVVLTFDDGTADFVEHAVPLLQRFAVPATLYVATSFVDSSTTFPWGAAPVSWSGLADAVSTGLVTIGSHTHTHRLLRDASEREVIDEVRRSSDLIADRLGVPIGTVKSRIARGRAALMSKLSGNQSPESPRPTEAP